MGARMRQSSRASPLLFPPQCVDLGRSSVQYVGAEVQGRWMQQPTVADGTAAGMIEQTARKCTWSGRQVACGEKRGCEGQGQGLEQSALLP